jgi:3-deoxy-7-phosphoheptulonate synthase
VYASNYPLDSVFHSPVAQYDPLIQPALLRHEVQSTLESHRTIASARFNAARIIAGHDDRVLVIVGPCSIHSLEQALDYAKLLKEKIPTWPNLVIIMRAYLCVLLSLSCLCLVITPAPLAR